MRGAPTVAVVGGVVALVGVGAVAVAVSLGGGGGDDTANGSVPVEQVGELAGTWVVVNHVSAPAPVVGTVRLVFSADGRVVAETGCNAVRGTVEVADSVLVAGPLVSTRMGCEPALTEQERWVTEMLSARSRLERSGPYLSLHWGADERWWLGLEREGSTDASVPAS